MTMPLPAPSMPLDIEFPLRTRSEDAAGADRRAGAPSTAIEIPTCLDRAPRAPLPFLVDRLLHAHGPFGLEVETKSEERVVGTWTIEVNPCGNGGTRVVQAMANLYVCASARGDARATGAFLVLRRWWVPVSDRGQVEQLYESLSLAALERLDSLVGGVPDETGDSRLLVLFLVDGRRLDRELFSLDRLQVRMLEDLECGRAIAGVDLRIAHRRGTGTPPHVAFASTLLSPLQTGDFGPDPGGGPAPGSLRPYHPILSEVFVRETLSPENRRWQRRASDRAAIDRR